MSFIKRPKISLEDVYTVAPVNLTPAEEELMTILQQATTLLQLQQQTNKVRKADGVIIDAKVFFSTARAALEGNKDGFTVFCGVVMEQGELKKLLDAFASPRTKDQAVKEKVLEKRIEFNNLLLRMIQQMQSMLDEIEGHNPESEKDGVRQRLAKQVPLLE